MKETLNSFLQIENVDFALFINGKWGSGKTYFIKTELSKILIPYKMKQFYFTVNGISNSSELHELITSKCLSNYFTPEKIPLFGKTRDRVSTFLKSLSSANNILKALKFSDFHFPNSTIIIIDDVERISPNYNYDEFLGYINREFIEQCNFKVILIGDASQERIRNSNFSLIKEKYIRWVVNFKSDIKSVIHSFIQAFNSESLYFQHLCEHEEYIFALINSFEIRNFRTVKFFFEIYKVVFENSSNVYKILHKDLLYFTLIISNEYRNGNFEMFANAKQLPQIVTLEEKKPLLFIESESELTEYKNILQEDKEKLKKFISEFERYTFNHYTIFDHFGTSYNFILPIYDLITKGEWNQENFENRLKELLKIKRPIISEVPNEYINQLAGFKDLNEKEFDDATDRLIEQIRDGKVNFKDFCRAFNFLIYLSKEKILKYGEEEVRDLLLKESNKIFLSTSDQHNYFDFFRFGIEIIEIKKFSSKAAEILEAKFNNFKLTLRANLAIQKLGILEENITDDNKFQTFRTIIENCDSAAIVEKISKEYTNRAFLAEFSSLFKDDYSTMNAGDFYFNEIPKLNEIKNLLLKRDWGKNDRLDIYFITQLIEQIDSSIENIKNTKSV